MLSANVLCLKKRKKRTYCLSGSSVKKDASAAKDARSSGGAVTMLQITEDTPPDMLAGAMDLTVHLPTGRAVKMAVERSTPMMDLLVQITTNHHLQLSNYTLQALGMAPSSEHSDKILPYKPNTPIGTLDTQHIKVIPKARSLPVPKNVPPGHQPFESTFRLKVHLPRNQLYVTRVSRNVLLENIMKKVCEEKNLDPEKYEFRHPGNLDEVLDPKLTLSDYQITEIYVVSRGASSLNQAFSTSDIMALRKEEERKQMHTKTGGGVFNLIFRRGKSSMGSGSISSDTRSISPTHSDDSRSVTPPAVQPQIITPPKKDQPQERPKPPQRKRRPAPKPPQQNDSKRKVSVEKPPSNISETANEVNELQSKKVENGLTICHSRNSSDSSGYHEASVLSENCSLPRRPKSAFVTGGDLEKMSKQHSQSTTNLSKMSSHSKSTTSLGIPGRKKKAAPPPPPVICSSNSSSIINVEKPSPVVASQPTIIQKESILSSNISPARDTLISVSSYQSNSLSTDQIKLEDKSFGSTDSGIAPENQIDKSSDLDVDRPLTPPPPPVLEKETKLSEPILPPSVISETTQGKIEEIKNDDLKSEIVPKRQPVKDIQEPKVEPIKELQISSVNKPVDELIKESTEQLKAPSVGRDLKTDPEISEIDWHYQLPSPPKAFRDSSPAHFNEDESFTGQSVTDFKDSVVTSPELFEKLKAVEDSQSEKGTVTSDLTSVVSEEEKPLLNTLSLENLEKRKSLVYNRELATSLKMTDIIESKSVKTDTFSSSLKQFESTYNEISKSSLPRETGELTYRKVNTSTHTLPNFKISTYDQPKQKIKVFEDDTIRSNTDYFNTNTAETTSFSSSHRKSDGGHSIEVLPVRKSSLDDQSNHSHEEREYKFYKPQVSAMPRSFGPMSSIFRSESFSIDNTWVPAKPVSRSKSQLTLNSNKYKEEKIESSIEDLSRSNSLYDVSGLQSLEVMKLIQNKLSTPTSSVENLNHKEKYSGNSVKSELKTKVAVQPTAVEKPQKPDVPEKIYKYRGPPSINMGTWSERPKIPVSVKEDADYKLGNNVSSKLIVNTTNNNVTSNNSIEVKNNISSTSINSTSYNKGSNVNVSSYDDRGVNNVSIKVNGTEPVSSMQTSGNVVIKIGILSSQNSKSVENQRFINHTTAMGYRKPFSNINKNQPTTRPHSVSYESDFDISRVPVVRSVELKKPYKGSNNNNTSVTQIYQGADSYKSHTLNRTEPVSDLKNKFSTKYRSSENLCNNSYSNHENNLSVGKDPKPIFRVNSYKPSIAPTVRGFKTSNDSANLTSRLSWNSPASYNTLPAKSKEKEGYTTNKDVPFSQSNLRRTESSKLVDRNGHNIEYNPNNYVEIHNEKNSTYNSLPSVTKSDIIKPPPPPSMPKANVKKSLSKPIGAEVDSRDQLLSAIRNFGGKKGLKAVKA
ncbi:uncharacterized protein LOC108906682 isoform X4 [Anoplophora glabripennis]|uniref:uncharacterized protein LOC108906682 isoform X4 n=1 Tax=Anoplophora glabripennis TaxID=217634 RepID=UPI000874A9C6|nr:uncharacterized protein LOC108906682 isoform X4 [Anoplophora glabripennis]